MWQQQQRRICSTAMIHTPRALVHTLAQTDTRLMELASSSVMFMNKVCSRLHDSLCCYWQHSGTALAYVS